MLNWVLSPVDYCLDGGKEAALLKNRKLLD